MEVSGKITLENKKIEVNGRAWMDHEFTSFKPKESTRGWDWFALGLDNGYDIMLYQIHNIDGETSKDSVGAVINEQNAPTAITMPVYAIETLKTWKSVNTGAAYPSQWKITLPKIPATLTVTPLLADQEMIMKNSDIIYWEGACSVTGTWGENEDPVKGLAYVELTGYDKPVANRF